MSMSDNRHDSSDEKDSLINDLRVSLNKSIKETSTIIENLKANVDSSIEDEENRKIIKENVNNIFKNFENTVSSTKTKIYENLDYPNITSEEE
jgi:hypothetical protein|tara:strand:- start:76 stop:354 length:279 start_codon:yes stop_codon:yes gene_type:complete